MKQAKDNIFCHKNYTNDTMCPKLTLEFHANIVFTILCLHFRKFFIYHKIEFVFSLYYREHNQRNAESPIKFFKSHITKNVKRESIICTYKMSIEFLNHQHISKYIIIMLAILFFTHDLLVRSGNTFA